jgi:TatD DNase family protein
LIDTHCHLTDPRLASQLDAVLFRAAAAGVTRCVTISTDIDDARECLNVCRGRENVRCAVGVHPTYVSQVEPDELRSLREIQADASVVAIGEVGLDYHYGTDNRQRQVDFFSYQLELATEVGRPVVIHCREAVDDCLAILRGFPAVRAVFHCFTGTADEARRVLDAGYLIGFTGVVTFKNCGELKRVATDVPAERFLVETDAPYLSPVPVRNRKVNEPAWVMHVAAVVAGWRGVTVAELDEQTTRNAAALFGWP